MTSQQQTIIVDKVSMAVRQALLAVLPQTLAKALAAGGAVGAAGLGTLRAAEELRALKPQAKVPLPVKVLPIKMTFNVANKAAADWVRAHAAQVAEDISQTSSDAIHAAVAKAQEEGGLREQYDAILAAVGDEARAELIARTEAMTAVNEGQRQAWAQAEDEGLLTGDERVEWIATSDACPEICEPLDGTTRPLDGEYDNPDGGDGPPAHPNCRCTEGISAR